MLLRFDGFARPMNSRPVYLALEGPESAFLPLELDARELVPGEDLELSLGVDLPEDLAAGTYQLGLWLPDSSQLLQLIPAFSIVLANPGSSLSSGGVNQFDAFVVAE